ncbi:MAG: hypothetical protein OSB19_06345 [Opitutaceae bacterium]|nr:hypothetical protein [Opitutaceae bacterium]
MSESLTAENTPKKSERLLSLDAYRGLIMVTLAFSGFGIARTAALQLKGNPDSWFWSIMNFQTSHAEWVGGGYWDMIQPSFMFMVGLSMAYSYVKRQREGQPYRRMLGHAVSRSLILILLGIFLTSHGPLTRWWMTNVLTQMGLGYAFLFLLWGRGFRFQSIAAGSILVFTWLLFVLYPNSGLDLEKGAPELKVSPAWAQEHLEGIDPSWHKNANVSHAFDTWFLNLLPKSAPFTGEGSPQVAKPFVVNGGGYHTLSFIPSLATMLFGLMCGELLRSKRSQEEKLKLLIIGGIGGIVVGWLLGVTGICPVVKRIWTPSWALYSTGWCMLILASLYWIIDMRQYRRWAFPLIVVGMNSIAIYSMDMLLKSWVAGNLKRHLGDGVFSLGGQMYAPMFQATLTGLVFWLICWWMYKQKLFVRI